MRALSRKQAGILEIILVELDDGDQIWVPAFSGTSVLLDAEDVARSTAAFMVAMVEAVISHSPEDQQNQLEENIKKQFDFLLETRYDNLARLNPDGTVE